MSDYRCGLPTAVRFIGAVLLIAALAVGLIVLAGCATLETRWCSDENTGQPRPCERAHG